MSHKRLFVAAGIITLVLAISFVLSVPHTRDVEQASTTATEAIGTPHVTVRDVFKKGVHTITGSLEAPNACSTVTAEAFLVDDGQREGILVAISLIEDNTSVCLQLPTSVNFTVTISAQAQEPIKATVNGLEATVTLL